MPRVFGFQVSPSLPARLEALTRLSLNLRWSWDHPTRAIFESLNPDVWEETNHNPLLLLGRTSQRRLAELASDEAFLAELDRAAASLSEYLSGKGWFGHAHPDAAGDVFAYFSAEFGLTECIPNYAGGLGILAGDHLKSASDLGLPLVGVGLLYQRGYFQQYLNADGWQQEIYPVNDFSTLPFSPEMDAQGKPLTVSLELPGRQAFARIWKVQVGRVPLYLLDTNVPQNSEEDRRITGSLYGGDGELRLQQEIVLGIGGMRALAALGIRPAVCHLNEGHSAFLGLERTRALMEELKVSFFEARQLAAAGSLFTTHTPVPAGFDRFDAQLMARYFGPFAERLGIPFERLMSYGRQNPSDPSESFNMAFLAARLSSAANGVSRLHGVITRKMVRGMWPGYPLEEIPVESVTNGVHIRSWVSLEMTALLNRYLGPRWAEEPAASDVWNRIDRIPDHELWRVHQIRRERLVNYSRQALESQLRRRGRSDAEISTARSVFNPDALTIGFARRFATYKRATLMVRDVPRLKRILTNPERPVQILIAGKAHPHDAAGKDLIRQIIHFAADPEIRPHVVFVEDYDIRVARHLVQGVDVWLNTPRRPNEASGTSGMKLLPNGGLNLSVLDGWWAEGYDREVGWAIGSGEDYNNDDYQDAVESDALYNLLETEVTPMFYERDQGNLPRRWIAKMKTSMKRLCPIFSTNRMVTEYVERFYLPSAKRYSELAAQGGARLGPILKWRSLLRTAGSQVKITRVRVENSHEIKVGEKLRVTASIVLGEIPPEYVRVQIVSGSVDGDGRIADSTSSDMKHAGMAENEHQYEGQLECLESGSYGFSVRVVPYHPDVRVPFEHPWLVWAE
ncbi:MAG TPA: alpha-glucan family phosphorylase [Bryobacteraceae bacterium]|nr:alpha-glucan family phosphorylase [Bryobacteraceae bacterium]